MTEILNKQGSFTVTNTIPLKIFVNEDVMQNIKNGRIIPIHLQLHPTNKCNRSCFFCSCSARDKNLEMDIDEAKDIIDKFASLGTKAVTITGGGEPLCYSHFNDLIDYFIQKDIKIGLVTNGLALHKVAFEILRNLTWCRISSGDDRTFEHNYSERLHDIVNHCPDVDWGFNHVVTINPNLDVIRKIVKFANAHEFTHVRIVPDLFEDRPVDMDYIRTDLKEIDDSRVIYQDNKRFYRGGDCYICYLKPVVAPDMKVYACSGTQVALEKSVRDTARELSLGLAVNIEAIIDQSNIPFDGKLCVKCYYKNYNDLLGGLMKDIKHKEFV